MDAEIVDFGLKSPISKSTIFENRRFSKIQYQSTILKIAKNPTFLSFLVIFRIVDWRWILKIVYFRWFSKIQRQSTILKISKIQAKSRQIPLILPEFWWFINRSKFRPICKLPTVTLKSRILSRLQGTIVQNVLFLPKSRTSSILVLKTPRK